MSDLEDIQNRLKKARLEAQKTKEEYEAIRKQQDEIRKRKAELHRLISAEIAKEDQLKESAYLIRKRQLQAEKDEDALQRELRRSEEENRILSELESKGTVLDALTSTAYWREFAFNHQIDGAKQLAIAERGILGDKRGLGKTLTSIAWLDMLLVDKSIIFCPKEAATAFRKQFPRWAPHRPLFDLVSQKPNIRKAFLESLMDIPKWNIIINLEAWRKDPSILEGLVELGAEAVIIDEAHSIKDNRTSMFKGVERVVYPDYAGNKYYDGVFRIPSVKYVLPMSGTTFLNYPDELWPLLYLVDRKAWPDKKKFIFDYLYQDPYSGRYVFNKYAGSEQRLLKQLGIRYLQRDRKDAGVVIPPQEIVVHEIEWDTEKYYDQYQAYMDLERKSAILLENMDESAVMGVEGLALFTRLRQMITWPAGIELRDPETKQLMFSCNVQQSIKVDFAVELLKQIKEESDRCVVFSQFTAPLNELKKRLDKEGIKAVILDGHTLPRMREMIKTDFDAAQTDENHYRWDVVLANYKVGGQSLDFTGARQMVCVDQEWNPGRNDQAYGRTDRIGQTKETIVHVIRVVDTIDDVMQQIIDRKAAQGNIFEESIKAGIRYLKGGN